MPALRHLLRCGLLSCQPSSLICWHAEDPAACQRFRLEATAHQATAQQVAQQHTRAIVRLCGAGGQGRRCRLGGLPLCCVGV